MNKEQAYDEQIAPLMTQIIEVATRHGIAMFASFMIPNDEDPELCCTTHLPDGDGNFRPEYRRAYDDIHGRPAPMHLRTEHGDGSVTMTAII